MLLLKSLYEKGGNKGRKEVRGSGVNSGIYHLLLIHSITKHYPF